MSRKTLSRRQFLRGLGGVCVGLPLLHLGGLPANGQSSGILTADGFPKRFIVFFHPNGTVQESWWPEAGLSETDFRIGGILTPLQRFKSRLILPQGLDMLSSSAGPGEPHQKGMGGLLSGRPLQEGSFVGGDGSLAGWGDGITVDQAIARHIGATTRFGSLELGVRADSNGGSEVRTRLIYSGPAQPLPPMNDPREVFDSLFSDFEADTTEMADRRTQRTSVLDTVQSQFGELRNKVGALDRQRLEAHFEIVRDMERRLSNERFFSGACLDTGRPDEREPDSEDTMPDILKLQIDLMVSAMACDLTRVGSIQVSNAKNHIRYPWLESLGDGHSLSHAGPSNDEARTELELRGNWLAQQFSYLLDRLDALPEGDGTMLDNTVVLWGNELAQGNIHSQVSMPFVLAGSAGGALKTGRHIQYANRPHNDLLVTLLNAFGLEDTTFGDERFCTGPLSELLV